MSSNRRYCIAIVAVWLCGLMHVLTLAMFGTAPLFLLRTTAVEEKLSLPTEQDYLRVYAQQVEFCGALCQVDNAKLPSQNRHRGGHVTVDYLREAYISTSMQCPVLFSSKANELLDGKPLEWPPPAELPMKDKFLLPGVRLTRWYKEQRYEGQEAYMATWTEELISGYVDKVMQGTLQGTYGTHTVLALRDILQRSGKVPNSNAVVVGTEKPWVEAVLLSLGAKSVTTLEYGKIKSLHPQVFTITPAEVNAKYRAGEMQEFDLAVSFSSLEHSGLGRYGDRLNPWGDVIWVAKLSCLVRQHKGGSLFLGLPSKSQDEILYNAQRTYGPKRWPLVLQNWQALEVKHVDQTHDIVYAENARQ